MDFVTMVFIGFIMILSGLVITGLSVTIHNEFGDKVFITGLTLEVLGLFVLGFSLAF